MINRIFATGYKSRNINDLKTLVESLRAILVDIRLKPSADEMFWRQIYLKTLLGKKYLHISNLGDRAVEADKFSVQNLKLGLKTLISLNSNSILFCECYAPENCHRRIIIGELQKRGIETTEISDWKLIEPT